MPFQASRQRSSFDLLRAFSLARDAFHGIAQALSSLRSGCC